MSKKRKQKKKTLQIEIRQFNKNEFDRNLNTIQEEGLVLECQVYGQSEEQFYNVAFPLGAIILFGRTIEDKGRTAGCWQCCGATGVLKGTGLGLRYSESLVDIILKAKEAEISYEGKTWLEIISKLPDSVKSRFML